MKKIRIAQIGVGHDHAEPTFESLKVQSDIFEIVGYDPVTEEEMLYPERMRIFDGYKRMTAEEIMADPSIEAVAIETQEKDLTKYAIMAAKAGKHIQMDKPGGMKLSDFEELVAILKEKKLAFQTGYMYRFNPTVIDAIERVKNGELGEIYSVEAQMSCRYPVSRREWLKCFGKGGMTFFLGCHLIDLVLQIQGRPEKIIPLTRPTYIDGVEACDFGMVVFEYKNGVSFIKTTSEERGGYMRRQLVISGSKGTIEIKPLEQGCATPRMLNNMVRVCIGDQNDEWGFDGVHSVSEEYNRYDAMLASFAAIARGEKENPYTLDYELELYKLVLECCDML